MVKRKSQTNSDISSCIRKLHSYGKPGSMVVAVPLAKYTRQMQKPPNQPPVSPTEHPMHGAAGHYGAGMVTAAALA